jgi:hypothetical protein
MLTVETCHHAETIGELPVKVREAFLKNYRQVATLQIPSERA